jgi:quaternary ammonium compound-resistance protein SugE
MNWILLIIAGLFEVGFASCLGKARAATGNAVYLWYGGFLFCLTISMLLLVKATQTLPIGTAYAVWTGIGAIGTVLVGIFVFKDPVSFWRLFFITTLIASIIGLKVLSPH